MKVKLRQSLTDTSDDISRILCFLHETTRLKPARVYLKLRILETRHEKYRYAVRDASERCCHLNAIMATEVHINHHDVRVSLRNVGEHQRLIVTRTTHA